ncbi:MAG: rhodanese-like domain-containing protein [Pirellulales bacterium]
MAKHSPRFLELVKRAKAAVRETSINDVRARLQSGQHFELVDVREDHEWQAGHVPKAVHLGRGVLERDVEQRIPDTSAEIVLYCGGGYRSALAAESLQRMGYTNVRSMDGGFRAWREAGLPIESSASQ